MTEYADSAAYVNREETFQAVFASPEFVAVEPARPSAELREFKSATSSCGSSCERWALKPQESVSKKRIGSESPGRTPSYGLLHLDEGETTSDGEAEAWEIVKNRGEFGRR